MADNLPVKYKESIFSKIVNKIKGLYGKDKSDEQKNEEFDYNIQKVNKNKLYRESMRKEPKELINKNSNSELLYKKGTIEYALDQFNKSLVYQNQKNGKVNPYKALIQLSGMAIELGEKNRLNEENLISKLKKQGSQFNVINQDDKEGNVYFYHIKTKKHLSDGLNEKADKMRIYINCKRKNVAKLASKLVEKFEDDSIYFKFSSDYQLSNFSRAESFVIYTDTKSASNIVDKLNDVYSGNKELFEGSKNMNPFLKNEGGYLSYAPEPKTDTYYKRNGKSEKIVPSYNNFLAKALQESFIRTARETIASSKELTEKTQRLHIR